MYDTTLKYVVEKFDEFIKNSDLFLKNHIESALDGYQKYINSIVELIAKNGYEIYFLFKKDYGNDEILKNELINKYAFSVREAKEFLRHTNIEAASFNYRGVSGKNFIFIHNEADNLHIKFVIFHELCHSLQRIFYPQVFSSNLPRRTKTPGDDNNHFMYVYRKETHADLFASLALIAISILKKENVVNIKNCLIYQLTSGRNSILSGYFSLPILKSLKINELNKFIGEENINFFGLYKYSQNLISQKLNIYSKSLTHIFNVNEFVQNEGTMIGRLLVDKEIQKSVLYTDIATTVNAHIANIDKLNNDPIHKLEGVLYLSKKYPLNEIQGVIDTFKKLVTKSK